MAAAVNAVLRRLPAWPLYWAGAAVAVWLFWRAATGRLGPDPVRTLEHLYGEIALWLLVLGLAVTPLRRLTGLSLLRFRRAIGLLAFAFVCFHVTVWLVLDIQLDAAAAWEDVFERPHITVGMLGLVMLIPLALTSSDRALRRMGPEAWRRLHMLVYPAALAGVVHYLMLVKTWEATPILWLAAILLLLALRLPWLRRAQRA